jgi:hypothetical protein
VVVAVEVAALGTALRQAICRLGTQHWPLGPQAPCRGCCVEEVEGAVGRAAPEGMQPE